MRFRDVAGAVGKGLLDSEDLLSDLLHHAAYALTIGALVELLTRRR